MKKGKRTRKFLSCILALVLTLSFTQIAFADGAATWDVSRSKTATELNANNESTVTLSIPSAEEQLDSDIVFVMDDSTSASSTALEQAFSLLNDLKGSEQSSGASINVCVVQFNRKASKSAWFDLSTQIGDIEKAMENTNGGGTNIHAGLLAGMEALNEHTDISADRKYLILISDGSTYLYSKDGNWSSENPFSRSYCPADPYNAVAGGFWDNSIFEPNNHPDVNVTRPQTTSDVTAWQTYFNDVEERNAESNGDYYDYHIDYDKNFGLGQPSADYKQQPSVKRSANNRDMAFYYANKTWQEITASGYNAYSVAIEDGMAGAGNADDSHSFMNYLNGGRILNFDEIENDIIYAVDAGSTVEDKMGSEFDLVPDTFNLTVGGTALTCTRNGNTYSFGDDTDPERFVVEYDETNDSFLWTINENVSKFAPVQLTYNVKLTNPATAAGTYTVPTNEYARVTPVSSTGEVGEQLDFDVPTVSYTVAEYTLSYDANGGTGNVNPAAGVAGTAVVIEQNGFERSGYTFTGWNTAADGSGTSYNAGDSFTMPADNTVLYAQWSKNAPAQVKLSYDANGGTGTMTPSTADVGSTFTIAQNGFNRSGFTFTGWNTAADGKGTAYKAGDSIIMTDKDTVLYAQWSKNASGSDEKPAKPDKPVKAPKTGDSSNMVMWIILLIVCVGAVTTAVVINRKKKHREN